MMELIDMAAQPSARQARRGARTNLPGSRRVCGAEALSYKEISSGSGDPPIVERKTGARARGGQVRAGRHGNFALVTPIRPANDFYKAF
jgi:hypothetical protein